MGLPSVGQGLCACLRVPSAALASVIFPAHVQTQLRALKWPHMTRSHSFPEAQGDCRAVLSLILFGMLEVKVPSEGARAAQARAQGLQLLFLSSRLPARDLPPSLTWGRVLYESCLAPSFSSLRQMLPRNEERQVGTTTEEWGGFCPVRRCSGPLVHCVRAKQSVDLPLLFSLPP